MRTVEFTLKPEWPQDRMILTRSRVSNPLRKSIFLGLADYRPGRVPSKTWRQLIQKVWEVDPLTCPRCGGMMKIIALIEEPAVVERILKHLELWREPEARRGDQRGTTPYDAAEALPDFVYEPVDDDWRGYEEPTFTLQ